jgi:hypothetical protein
MSFGHELKMPTCIWRELNGIHVMYDNGQVKEWNRVLPQDEADMFIQQHNLGHLLPSNGPVEKGFFSFPVESKATITIDPEDAEWLELHAQFTTLREKKSWSIKQGLAALKLPVSSATMQYISRCGSHDFPSKRPNTIGFQVRMSLKKFLSSSQLPIEEVTNEDELLYQWCLDNNKWLRENHVEKISEGPDSSLQIFILEDKAITANALRDKLFSVDFPPLPTSLKSQNAVFVKQVPLGKPLESPIGIVKENHGTAFLMNVGGTVCAVTSKHVIVKPENEHFPIR